MTYPEVRRFVGKTTTVALWGARGLLTGVLTFDTDGTYTVHWSGVREDPTIVQKFVADDVKSITAV
jgi:hypothetical protein